MAAIAEGTGKLAQAQSLPRTTISRSWCQQVRKRFALQGDLHPFDLGEDAEADLTRLVGQRDHQLRRWAMEGLPVLIWLLPARRLDRVSALC
jgi:hypothetical protein